MKDRAFKLKAKVINNQMVAENCCKLVVSSSEISKYAKPGQFLEIKASEGFEPLLRRPFSIHRVQGSNIEVLYELVGKGTELLSQKIENEYLDIIGPLGTGFNLKAKPEAANILVAGGMGVAPLLFLAEKLIKRKAKSAKRKITVLIGARSKEYILCEKEFKSLGCDVKIATDDGSAGYKGKVTELLKHLLRTMNYKLSTIYACGPKPMLKSICEISENQDIPAQISMEEHMACGIGACLGCVVKTKEGYKRVCKEGPVFDAQEIVWSM